MDTRTRLRLGAVLAVGLMSGCGASETFQTEEQPLVSRVTDRDIVAIARFDQYYEGAVPFDCMMDGTTSHSTDPKNWIVAYRWDFGDGSPPSDHGYVRHVYTEAGNYSASLTVTDRQGRQATVPVTVRAYPRRGPEANIGFNGSKPAGAAPLKQNFDGTFSSHGEWDAWIASFAWDFGDGVQLNGMGGPGWRSHTYASPGTYDVKLTVTDTKGLTSTVTRSVRVCAAGQTCAPTPGSVRWVRHLRGTGDEVPILSGLGVAGTNRLVVAPQVDSTGVDFGFRRSRGNFRGTPFVLMYTDEGEAVTDRGLVLDEQEDAPHVLASAVATSASQATWISGSVQGRLSEATPPISDGFFLLRFSFDNLGRYLPSAAIQLDVAPRALAVDGSENVYAVFDSAIFKYSQTGQLEWQKSYGSGLIVAASDPAGNLLVGGADAQGRAELSLHGPQGNLLWAKTLSSGQGGISDVAINGAGQIAAAGQYVGSIQWAGAPMDSSGGAFVVAGTVGGGESWAKSLNLAQGVRAALDAAGSVAVGGYSLTAQQTTVVQYGADGTQQWSRALGKPFSLGAEGDVLNLTALEAHPSGLAAAGWFTGSQDIGGIPLRASLRDGFLLDIATGD